MEKPRLEDRGGNGTKAANEEEKEEEEEDDNNDDEDEEDEDKDEDVWMVEEVLPKTWAENLSA